MKKLTPPKMLVICGLGIFFSMILGNCSIKHKGSSELASEHTPIVHTNDDLNIISYPDRLIVTLKNSEEAKLFYDAMGASPEDYGGNITKKILQTTQDPGAQELQFECTKDVGLKKYYCALSVEKRTSVKKAYKFHSGNNDSKYLVIRNDTDYDAPGKAIFDAFPNQILKPVVAGNDPFAGVNVIGGQGIFLPQESDHILQLQCRNDGSKYFCEFLIKNPWPNDYNTGSNGSGGGGGGVDSCEPNGTEVPGASHCCSHNTDKYGASYRCVGCIPGGNMCSWDWSSNNCGSCCSGTFHAGSYLYCAGFGRNCAGHHHICDPD